MLGNSKADHTAIDSYNIVKEVTGGATDTLLTAFPFGVTSGDMDLLSAINGGAGEETKAYRLEILVTAKPAGTGTIAITGASEGGPEEMIGIIDIDCTADVVESGDWRVIDVMDLTSYHLNGCGIATADSGNDRVAKFGFDAIGYRYIKFYVTSLTTITDLRIYARYF